MDSKSLESSTHKFIEALHALESGTANDADALVALFAADATLTNSALDLKHGEVSGRDGIGEFWKQYKKLLGEAATEFHHITLAEEAAGLFWTTKGIAPTGEEVSYHGATLLTFNPKGAIIYLRGYYDTRELRLQAEE